MSRIDDCWNRIGVVGDQSCPKLVQHVHCRNCEVYAAAAQQNLQRPVDTAYRQHWAGVFRQPEQEADADASSALVFRVGQEWLSLPTRLFQSVAPTAPPHRLPHRTGGALLGVVNVAGKLYPAVSLAAVLGIDDSISVAEAGRHTFARLLVLDWEGQAYALPVADLHGIVRYSGAALRAPAATINKGLLRFLTGVLARDERQVGCLDAALLGHHLERALR
ncbi:MAG: chemotaxis protein CheW [Pseudomonadota bacterium]